MIEKAAGKLSVNRACKLMKVRRQGYYEYLSGRDSLRKTEDRQLTAKIKNIFYESNRIYGARKIREELRKGGDRVSRKRVRRLMDEAGLAPVTWRRSVHTTVSDPKAAPFPNLLKQDFRVALPNHTWVSDFTYVPTDEGWLYRCTFVDLFSRRVVGWAASNTIDRQLAIAAFRAIGACGCSRIDFLLDNETGELFANEINTIPGSLAFYLWEKTDLPFPALMDELVRLALKRQRQKGLLHTSFETNLLQNAQLGGAKGAKP